jgi:hypothetical protein
VNKEIVLDSLLKKFDNLASSETVTSVLYCELYGNCL